MTTERVKTTKVREGDTLVVNGEQVLVQRFLRNHRRNMLQIEVIDPCGIELTLFRLSHSLVERSTNEEV
jgi:hypothetical protein